MPHSKPNHVHNQKHSPTPPVVPQIIVDGPLSSLKLDKNRYTPLRVTVGSLCGYVCQLTYDSNNNSWEGPFIIVQDLWNPTINTEESVLVVDIWNNYIAIGTQLGRCLLYATHDSENYFPIWKVILPVVCYVDY